MRKKRYFWDREYHYRLEEAMGLIYPESDNMKRLREACGMSTPLVTQGLNPSAAIGIFSYPCKIVPPKWGLPETDTRIELELTERIQLARS